MAKNKKRAKGSTSKPMSDKRFISEKARSLPLFGCYVTEEWEKTGMAHVIVARERGNGNLCVGMFLCDTWCLGVKDTYGNVNITKEDFTRNILNRSMKFKECDYIFAHNLIYGAEAFAADAGIDTHTGFALWSRILEEDTDDIPLIEMEFGDHGKYHLTAERGSKESLYAERLKQRLGEDFIFDIGYGPGVLKEEYDYRYDYPDEEYEEDQDDSEYESFMSENAHESMEEILQRMSDGLKTTREEDLRHPDEIYSYQHPTYPDRLEIKHKFIAEEFSNPANTLVLPINVIDRILAHPKDEVVSDISNIIMYTIGKTWKAIDEDKLEWSHDDTIIHSLAFLTQLGDDAGLEAVMEVMRQNDDFRQFHLGDTDGMLLANAIYATGRNRTNILEEFLMHPGYDGFAKDFVSDAICLIGIKEPNRRDEVIEIYRRYLNFMQENIPLQNGCSGYVAGSIMSDLIDLKANELLPEIKKLHDYGYVNLNICGSYEDVEDEINSNRDTWREFEFTDIKAFYKELQRVFKQ